MKIIKRHGSEETFDRENIKDAIRKANTETEGAPELTDLQIDYISLVIEEYCDKIGADCYTSDAASAADAALAHLQSL